MKIDVFSVNDPMTRLIAESWVRALRFYRHDAGNFWHVSDSRPGTDLGIEIGKRFAIGTNIGIPLIHYITDPLEVMPGEWIESTMKGHLFFFADYATSVKAHQQGIRTAEYLPMGADSLAPQKRIEGEYTHEFFLGHMGIPTPDLIHRLHEVKEYKPDAKIGIWGQKEAWEETDYADCWVAEIPNTNTIMDELNRCRFYLSDTRYTRPDYFCMQAMQSDKCMGIAPFSSDLWECFEQSRFMFGPNHLRAFFKDMNSEATYRNEKEDQIKVISHGPQSLWKNPVQAIHCAPFWNRMIDRMFFLMTLLDKKELYVNAKAACPKQGLAKFVLDKPKAKIEINYPEENKNLFNFKIDGMKIEEVPLLLRRVARQIEVTYLAGNLVENTIAIEGV